MASKPLFDDEDSSSGDDNDDDKANDEEEDQHRIHVNQKFAKEYQTKKQLEELRNSQHRHDNYNNNSNDDDESNGSSEDESEDENGELLTPHLDVSILKTINALRKKDESIYDPSATFFQEPADNNHVSNSNNNNNKNQTKKKKHFKDVLRDQILDQMEDDDDDKDAKVGVKVSSQNRNTLVKDRLEYDAEQKDLRSAFHTNSNDDDDHDDNDEDILVVKKRAEPVVDEDLENEYKVLQNTTTKGELKDPRGEVQDADNFLFNFLKNKKWVDKDDNSDEDDEPKKRNNIIGANNDDDDDDSIDDVDRADEFESKFNFRFEEAQTEVKSGADFSVVGYARSGTMDTLRRKDDTRRQKRLDRHERKAAERKAKEEQLRRLKNAKRHEMEMKLNEIKKVIGSVNDVDEDALMKLMEGDYDPDKFEKLMQDTYGDDFYEKEETQWKSDLDVRESLLQDEDGKMLVGEDDVDGGMYDDGGDDYDDDADNDGEEEYHGEEDNGYDDDEMLPPADSAVEQKLKTKLQEELYKLDYEDIVAGMPTRFKYRKVEANNFGLATHEILMARDTTLKNFVSLKKIAPYRDDGEFAVGYKKRRRFRDMLQEDLEQTAKEAGIVEREQKQVAEKNDENDGDDDDDDDLGGKKKRRRRQKKGTKKMQASDDAEEPVASVAVDDEPVLEKADDEALESGKKKRRKKKGKKEQAVAAGSSEKDTQRRSEDVTDGKEISPGVSKVPEVDKDELLAEKSELGMVTQEAKISKKRSEKRKSKAESSNKKPSRKKMKQSTIEGVPASRLKAYGL